MERILRYVREYKSCKTSDFKNLIGKRVYNYENGDYIELGIE